MSTPKYIHGDKVLYYDEIKTIKENLDMPIGTSYTVLDSERKEDCVEEEELKGVPLTPQILEANGWIKNPFGEGGFIEKYTQNGLTLFIYHTEDDEWICRIGDYDVKIKLVHQFQHLLFGLGLDSELKV